MYNIWRTHTQKGREKNHYSFLECGRYVARRILLWVFSFLLLSLALMGEFHVLHLCEEMKSMYDRKEKEEDKKYQEKG
jgi:hypothetical protein